MANLEHLKILRQGVPVWNQWRDEHRETRPDFVRAHLNKANLAEADFSVTICAPSVATSMPAVVPQCSLARREVCLDSGCVAPVLVWRRCADRWRSPGY